MAQEKKGKAAKADKSHDDTEEAAVSAKESASEEGHSEKSHAADDKAHPASHADHGEHEHKPNRKEYYVIFVALLVLTILEVAVAQVPGISKTLMRLSLVGMALAKAGLVAMFYMHLKHETKIMRLTVAIPLATPMLYAVILISEAAWRLIR